jgi:hypothetical protein
MDNNNLSDFEKQFIASFTAHLQANPKKRYTLENIKQMKELLNSLRRSCMINAKTYNHLIEFLNAFPTWEDMPEDNVDIAWGIFPNKE